MRSKVLALAGIAIVGASALLSSTANAASVPKIGTISVVPHCNGNIAMNLKGWTGGEYEDEVSLTINGQFIFESGFANSYSNTQNEWPVDERTHTWSMTVTTYDSQEKPTATTKSGMQGPCAYLKSAKWLTDGQSLFDNYPVSPNSSSPAFSPPMQAKFQACQLVVRIQDSAQWSSHTANKGKDCRLVLRKSGDLQIVSSGNKLIWHTRTSGLGNLLDLRHSGDLELRSAKGKVLWRTHTHYSGTVNP